MVNVEEVGVVDEVELVEGIGETVGELALCR